MTHAAKMAASGRKILDVLDSCFPTIDVEVSSYINGMFSLIKILKYSGYVPGLFLYRKGQSH